MDGHTLFHRGLVHLFLALSFAQLAARQQLLAFQSHFIVCNVMILYSSRIPTVPDQHLVLLFSSYAPIKSLEFYHHISSLTFQASLLLS